MALFIRRARLAAFLLLVVVATTQAQTRVLPPPRPEPRPETPWWQNEQFQKDLGLTTDQVARIEKLWKTTRTDLRQEWDELSHQEDKLSQLIQTDADETVLARQIDRVETARANAGKTRSLMLVRMLRVLSPEQRIKFNGLYDRWREGLQRQSQPPDVRKKPDDTHKDPNSEERK